MSLEQDGVGADHLEQPGFRPRDRRAQLLAPGDAQNPVDQGPLTDPVAVRRREPGLDEIDLQPGQEAQGLRRSGPQGGTDRGQVSELDPGPSAQRLDLGAVLRGVGEQLEGGRRLTGIELQLGSDEAQLMLVLRERSAVPWTRGRTRSPHRGAPMVAAKRAATSPVAMASSGSSAPSGGDERRLCDALEALDGLLELVTRDLAPGGGQLGVDHADLVAVGRTSRQDCRRVPEGARELTRDRFLPGQLAQARGGRAGRGRTDSAPAWAETLVPPARGPPSRVRVHRSSLRRLPRETAAAGASSGAAAR